MQELFSTMIMDTKQYFIPQMKQLYEKTWDTDSKKRGPSNRQTTNAETSLNGTNTGSTVRTLPRRFERQRRPLDKYAIIISNLEERDVVTAYEHHH